MTNFRASGRIAAIAAAITLVATPAFAAPSDPTADKTKQERKEAKSNQQYCVQDEITGSRMPRKVCKTRAEWIAQDGFDPISQH